MAGNLRPVDPNKPVKKPKGRPGRPKKLSTAVNTGDEREFLVALRRQIASKFDDGTVSASGMAALIKQLRDVDRAIRVIDARESERLAEEAGFDDDDDDAGWDPSTI